MTNKRRWLGILALGLVFGMTLVGCDDGNINCIHTYEWKVTTPATETEEGLETETCSECGDTKRTRIIPPIGNGFTGDTDLNGTWIGEYYQIMFYNGNYEWEWHGFKPSKGIYTTIKFDEYNVIIFTRTHIYYGTTLYSLSELKNILVPSEMTEVEFLEIYASAMAPAYYSINGNMLILYDEKLTKEE